MRMLVPALAVALVLPLTGCKREFKDFKEFSPSDGNYTILMPGDPNRETRDQYGLNMTVYSVERWGEGYGVASADIPPGTPFDINGAVPGLANKVNGTYKVEGTDRNRDGWREFEVEGRSPKKIYAGRVVVARGRFYVFFAVGDNTRLSNPQVRAFIDSFRLNDGDTPGPNWGIKQSPQGGMPQAGQFPPLPPRPGANPSAGPPQNKVLGKLSDPQFRDAAQPGGMLVGLEFYCGEFFGEPVINAGQPIFRVDGREIYGGQHGIVMGNVQRIQAKPGYAIGALSVKYGMCFDGCSATFMRVEGNRLNPADAYESEWIGWNGAKPITKLGGDGTPAIGILGNQNDKTMSGMGLMFRRDP